MASRLPRAADLPQQRRVDDPVPERPDDLHVEAAEAPVRLHVHAELCAVEPVRLQHPADVQAVALLLEVDETNQ